KVMFEPRSIVTYVFPCRAAPLTDEDLPYFLLRWSPEWQLRSLDRLEKKWGVEPDGLVKELRSDVYWRHFEGVVKPRIKRMPIIGQHPLWIRAANRAIRPLIKRKVASL